MRKPKRQRCPICMRLVEHQKIKEHIWENHFPYHCTSCLRISQTHPMRGSSPDHRIPCEGGRFVLTERDFS